MRVKAYEAARRRTRNQTIYGKSHRGASCLDAVGDDNPIDFNKYGGVYDDVKSKQKKHGTTSSGATLWHWPNSDNEPDELGQPELHKRHTQEKLPERRLATGCAADYEIFGNHGMGIAAFPSSGCVYSCTGYNVLFKGFRQQHTHLTRASGVHSARSRE